MNCFEIWTHIYVRYIDAFGDIFQWQNKSFISQNEQQTDKKGVAYKVFKKYPIILYSSFLYHTIYRYLLFCWSNCVKKKNPKKPVISVVIPGFCSCHVVVFLNQEKWIWCIACNKWNVFQIPIMSPQVKETMLGQHSKHTLAQTVL